MKLNTKLGLTKPKPDEGVASLRDQVQALTAEVRQMAKPTQEAKMPGAFTLAIKRREDGLIQEVRAAYASTGKLFCTFDVRRDYTGSVVDIAATPQEV